MSKTLLSRAMARRDSLVAERDATINGAEQRADKSFTETEEARLVAIAVELRTIDDELPALREAMLRDESADATRRDLGIFSSPARVISEPRTYDRDGRNSYFVDLALANAPGQFNAEARERLNRHSHEVRVDAKEYRANMSMTDGQGGEFVPPLWLVAQYVRLARASRVTADLCAKLPLPEGTDTISLPTVATGSSVAAQTEGSAASNTDMTTSSVTANVRTFAGQQVFSLQLLERSPIAFDQVVFGDLLAEHAKVWDTAVINGSGAPSVTGILNTSSIVSVSYTDASPTVAELMPELPKVVSQIARQRYLPPQAWVMHPRRWFNILGALDSSNRPFSPPASQGPSNAQATFGDVRAEGAAGSLFGLPVYVDPNIPTDLGGGTEDAIICARFDDLITMEGPIRTRVLYETDANTLQVRLQLFNYAAFMPNRYPKAIGKVTGTGLAAPTGY